MPLLVCEPVIAETMHVLAAAPGRRSAAQASPSHDG
jgi:hypothetical protein